MRYFSLSGILTGRVHTWSTEPVTLLKLKFHPIHVTSAYLILHLITTRGLFIYKEGSLPAYTLQWVSKENSIVCVLCVCLFYCYSTLNYNIIEHSIENINANKTCKQIVQEMNIHHSAVSFPVYS